MQLASLPGSRHTNLPRRAVAPRAGPVLYLRRGLTRHPQRWGTTDDPKLLAELRALTIPHDMSLNRAVEVCCVAGESSWGPSHARFVELENHLRSGGCAVLVAAWFRTLSPRAAGIARLLAAAEEGGVWTCVGGQWFPPKRCDWWLSTLGYTLDESSATPHKV